MFELIQDWWKGITERERKLTCFAGVVIGFSILYLLLWEPLASSLTTHQQQLQRAEQTLQWVEINAEKLISEGIPQNSTTKQIQNLPQLINRTAQRHGINISRLQHQNEQVNLWINEVEFSLFLRWIAALKNNEMVNVLNVDISQHKDSGAVKINRLSLSY